MTTFMGLTLPTVLDPVGSPAWATTVNANFNLLDAHDHTINKGTKVPVAGLNLNADLDLSNLYRIKRAYTVACYSQTAAITGDTGSFQNVAGNFVWVNNAGTAVQITAGAGLNLSSVGTIGGDYGGADPASVFYTNATKAYSFTQSSGITGHIDCGDVYIYESIASGKYVHLKPKTALASNIDIQLPSTLPSETSYLTMTSAGVVEASVPTDSSVPIGSIIPFYDYGALAFNTAYWAYCNGQTKTVLGVSRVLPDMSNRYLVGFGTEGGADIGSATWSITPVGNASHNVTLTGAQSGIGAHAHTASSGLQNASHAHTGSTGTESTTHIHSYGWSSGGASGSSAVKDVTVATAMGYINTSSENQTHTHAFSSGTETANHSHAITVNTITDTTAVSAHSIQPRSISVRFIMRIA